MELIVADTEYLSEQKANTQSKRHFHFPHGNFTDCTVQTCLKKKKIKCGTTMITAEK